MDAPVPRTVALTGATGFVGARILECLLAEPQTSVRALTRRPQPTRSRLTWVPGDLMNKPALKTLTEGADAVIHCAGLTKARSAADFISINVEGTRNLAITARESKSAAVPHFVLMSSFAAREPQLSAYASSKNQGEAAAIAELGTDNVTILRPPAIYGPGDEEVLKLLRAMARGIAPQAGALTNRFAMIHVDDLAEAAASLLGRPEGRGKTLEIDDGVAAGYSMSEIAAIVGEALERTVRPMPVPGGALTVLAVINEMLAAISSGTPMLSRGKVRELTHGDWTRKGQSLESLGFWTPRRPAITALPEAIHWHRSQGQL